MTTRRRYTALAAALALLSIIASSSSFVAAQDASTEEEFTTAEFIAPAPGSLMNFDPSTLFGALVNHTVVVAFTVEWCALCKGYVPEFERVAAAFANATAVHTVDGTGTGIDDEGGTSSISTERRSQIIFGTVDADAHKRLAATFGVTNAPYVALLRHNEWYDKPTGIPHAPAPRYAGFLGASPTVQWLNSQLGTDVESEPIVKDLVDDDIEAYVTDRDADVLVEFYAPWCGHCKKFAPFYHEVGQHFNADPSVKVARLNVDDNREAAAKYQVTGLPSLQLFPRGYKKRGLHFRGTELTPANVISFVKSPQVYLVEAAVTDMREWDCVLWLESRGVLTRGSVSAFFGLTAEHLLAFESVAGGGAEKGAEGGAEGGTTRRVTYDVDPDADADAAARTMMASAHRWAERRRWLETMETLTCLAHTPALRRTGVGSSPAMWNFLDNAKLHVEDPSLAGDDFDLEKIESEEDFAQAVAAAEAAAAEASAETAETADDDTNDEQRHGFDWHAWEEFTARGVGDSRGGGGVRELDESEFSEPEL